MSADPETEEKDKDKDKETSKKKKKKSPLAKYERMKKLGMDPSTSIW